MMEDPAAGGTRIEGKLDGTLRHFPLEGSSAVTIGRGDHNTIVLANDIMASRRHALIQRGDAGHWYLTDLGSRNGTALNGRPVTAPSRLRDGDTLMVGRHIFTFRDAEPLPAAATAETPAAAQHATQIQVITRMITVLVLDIRGYTVLSRELGEAGISEIMNRFFHAAGAVLREKGSWAQKYIGDAVMAIWIHDRIQVDPSDLRAVAEAVDELSGVLRDLESEYAPPRPLAFGAGVNSGLAAVGNMGSAGLADHTAMGDAVNKAFRLEAASKELGRDLVVGSATYELMSLPPESRTLFTPFTVQLKGYDEPEKVYALGREEMARLAGALGG